MESADNGGQHVASGRRVGDDRKTASRSVEYYLAESERMALVLQGTAQHPSDREALSWFQAELDALLHTISDQHRVSSWPAVLALWKSLVPFCVRVRAWECLEQVSGDAIVAAEQLGDRGSQLDALHTLAIAKQLLGDQDLAEALYEQVVQGSGPNEPLRRAQALGQWAQIKWRRGQMPEANRMLRQAAVSYRTGGNHLGEARALGDLASLLDDHGAEQKALETYAEALEIFRALGAKLDQAVVLANIGLVHLKGRRASAALEPLEQAAAIYRELQSDLDEARTLRHVASAHLELGHIAESEAAFRRALDIFDRKDEAEAEETRKRLWLVGTIVAVDMLLAADSDHERRLVVEQHPNLLEERADKVLTQRLSEARTEGGVAVSRIEDARRLLEGLRRERIEETFDAIWMDLENSVSVGVRLPPTLKELILSILNTRDSEHALALLDQALGLVGRDRHPAAWAMLATWLGRAYLDSPSGSRPEHFEAAIEHLTSALDLLDRFSNPEAWAETQILLGRAYRSRIRGLRAGNIEHAIGHLRQALGVYRRAAHPLGWAHAVHNLANCYGDRIVGDRARNLERAIRRLHAAQQVFTQEGARDGAAMANANLGLRYVERVAGNHAENIEMAIKHLHRALNDQSEMTDTAQLVATLMNLGLAYTERVYGDRAENLEDAVRYLKRCFYVCQRARRVSAAADAAIALGNAYSSRRQGQYTDNVETAIEWYERAQGLYPREQLPVDWAMATDSLGNAYHVRVHGSRGNNLRQSVALHKEALAAFDRQDAPLVWARILHNLAVTLLDLDADHTDQAIALLNQALEERRRESAPLQWAESLDALAGAFAQRTADDRIENLERAAALYRQALEVYDPSILPAEATRTWAALGDVLAALGRWPEAAAAYEPALEAAERRYQASVLQPARQAELEVAGDLPQRASYAIARSGDVGGAVVALERGRARELGDVTGRDRADLTLVEQVDPDAVAAYHRAAARVRALEAAGRAAASHMTAGTESTVEADAMRAEAHDAAAELAAVVEGIRRHPGGEGFLVRPGFSEVANVVRPGMAIAYLLTRPQGSLALIVCRDLDAAVIVESLWLDSFDTARLEALLVQEDDDHQVIGGYLAGQLAGSEPHPGRFEALLTEVLDTLGANLIGPLADRLRRLKVRELVLVSGGRLGLLPLHAAKLGNDGSDSYLSDEFEISYAPSARVLAAAADSLQARQDSPLALTGVGDPSQDLAYARAELEEVAASFPQEAGRLLYGQEATKARLLAALSGASYVHLSCHSVYDPGDPLDSHLLLAYGERLTLRELLDGRQFSDARLVAMPLG
jgi:tetratricopeptide (TPR) repeat protein